MLCSDPVVLGIGRAFGCGRCYFCRKLRARVWTHRMILEAALHKENCFVTLTYSDDQLPKGGTLVPSDLTLFLKKIRRRTAPTRLRYFAVGEYGSKTRRPHYHLALFGYPACASLFRRNGRACTCAPCSAIADSWRVGKDGPVRGHIQLGELSPASAAYIAGYVTKTLEHGDHWNESPDGCIPAFSRQSNRPGIGSEITYDIASQLMQFGSDGIQNLPGYLSHGRIKWPIGRYLRNRIREQVGISREEATRYALERIDEEMSALRQAALQAPSGQRTMAFKELVVSENDEKRRQILARDKIRKQKKVL